MQKNEIKIEHLSRIIKDVLPEATVVVVAIALSFAILFWSGWYANGKIDKLFRTIGLHLPRVSIEIKLSRMTESPNLYGFTIDKTDFTHYKRKLSFSQIFILSDRQPFLFFLLKNSVLPEFVLLITLTESLVLLCMRWLFVFKRNVW